MGVVGVDALTGAKANAQEGVIDGSCGGGIGDPQPHSHGVS